MPSSRAHAVRARDVLFARVRTHLLKRRDQALGTVKDIDGRYPSLLLMPTTSAPERDACGRLGRELCDVRFGVYD
jgi:hypothetical protein